MNSEFYTAQWKGSTEYNCIIKPPQKSTTKGLWFLNREKKDPRNILLCPQPLMQPSDQIQTIQERSPIEKIKLPQNKFLSTTLRPRQGFSSRGRQGPTTEGLSGPRLRQMTIRKQKPCGRKGNMVNHRSEQNENKCANECANECAKSSSGIREATSEQWRQTLETSHLDFRYIIL